MSQILQFHNSVLRHTTYNHSSFPTLGENVACNIPTGSIRETQFELLYRVQYIDPPSKILRILYYRTVKKSASLVSYKYKIVVGTSTKASTDKYCSTKSDLSLSLSLSLTHTHTSKASHTDTNVYYYYYYFLQPQKHKPTFSKFLRNIAKKSFKKKLSPILCFRQQPS